MDRVPDRLWLDLDPDTVPIAGRIGRRDGGDPVEFQGWIGLATALERLAGSGSPQPDPTKSPTP
jgi:hypothetical protein